jgi:hypothetical protein
MFAPLAQLGTLWRPPAVAASFLPSDIAGLNLWLDAAKGLYDATSGGNLVTANAGVVKRWEDQSGSGNHQTGTSTGITLRTNIVNGLPVVRGGGASGNSMSGALAASSTRTLFVVAQQRSTGSYRDLCGFGTTAEIYAESGHVNYYLWAVGGGTNTDWQVFGLKFTSVSACVLYINGSSSASFDPEDSFASDTQFLLWSIVQGVGDWDVAEVLHYPSVLGDTDRSRVETYLKSKYAIA